MKEKLLLLLGRIIPTALLIVLLPLSLLCAPFVWMYKKIKRVIP